MGVFLGALCLAFVINILMPLSEILVSLSVMAHKISWFVLLWDLGLTQFSFQGKSHDQRKGEREKNGKTDWAKEQRAKRPWQGAREGRGGSPSFPEGTCFLKRVSKCFYLQESYQMKRKRRGYCQDTVGLKDWQRGPWHCWALDAGLELWEKGKCRPERPTTDGIVGRICLSFFSAFN